MNKAYTVVKGLEEFSAAREQLEGLIRWLEADAFAGLEHGEIELHIEQEGREILRRLFQGHLDLRAQREEPHLEVIGSDGIARRHGRSGSRALESLFGTVRVERRGYGCSKKGTQQLCPMDAELNLPKRKYSHGLQRRLSEEVVKVSFDASVCSIAQHTGGSIPKRQAEALMSEISQDFESFYEQQAATEPEVTEELLIMSMDGKGVVMRRESLRDQTRRSAECSQQKLKTRLSAGEKRDRKRMATVATVYSITPHRRTAESIMNINGDEADLSPKPRAKHKRIWASLERNAKRVTEEVFDEAQRRDPNHARTWAMLVDGQSQQLAQIKKTAPAYGVEELILILDFIHVLEYLWKAAYCFFSPGTEEAEAWVLERALHLLRGKASDVAAGMRRSATLRNLSQKDRAGVDRCAKYLLDHREMLRYNEYLVLGLPIATGVIEGACRHLIADRMDITGARWGLTTAEAVLKLRSLHSSGDLDAYWEFHNGREYDRHQASQYPLSEAA